MTYKVSAKGIAEIAAHEGIITHPYLDSVGVWTIGVGHTANAGAPNPKVMYNNNKSVTVEEALGIFASDLEEVEERLNRHLPKGAKQHQVDAAASFDLNTGGIDEAWWVGAWKAGDLNRAAEQIMNWKRPAEIIPRRRQEQLLFKSGAYSNKPVVVAPADREGDVLSSQAKSLPAAEVIRRYNVVTGGRVEPMPMVDESLEGVVKSAVFSKVNAFMSEHAHTQVTPEKTVELVTNSTVAGIIAGIQHLRKVTAESMTWTDAAS